MAYYKEVGEVGGYKIYLTNIPLFIYKGSGDNKSGSILIYDNDENGWKYIGGCRQIKITTMHCSSMKAKNSLT